MATMVVMLNAKCPTPSHLIVLKPAPKQPVSLLSLHGLPKALTTAKPSSISAPSTSLSAASIAGAVFATLTTTDAALAAQQIADIAEGDNRGLALLIPIIPAVLWVLYNILQPALNQLNRMRTEKGVVVGLGLGGGLAAAAGLAAAPSASAGELMMVADAASSSSDSRGLLLLFVVGPAILWVLYNILQPALNQINRMRSG